MAAAGEESRLRYFGRGGRWRLVSLRDIWQRRELLWMLSLRDLKVRYRQTLVGVAWAALQPVASALIFVVLFGLLGKAPTEEGAPYAVVAMCGVLLWQLFAGIVGGATTSLVANQQLIGKVYFPRILLPLATVLPNLLDFAIGFVLLLGVMAYKRVAPGWTIPWAPAFVLLTVVAAVAVGVWLSALNAIYRDTGYAVPFLLQVGFFVSPVIYASSVLVPQRWRLWLALNPMTGAIEGFRWSLLGHTSLPFRSLLVGVAVVGVVLVTGLMYFRRVEGYLADRI
jgi:lipopolysaccharide transport system permease protein